MDEKKVNEMMRKMSRRKKQFFSAGKGESGRQKNLKKFSE